MQPQQRTLLIQILLFLATIVTTTLAGAEWIFGRSFADSLSGMGWYEFKRGFQFSIPFLTFLTVHEFGHYFMAKKKNIAVSLPYYIPIWLGYITTIGTAGAFIRIKEQIKKTTDYFDIGIAGPLAGFVIAVFTLWFGFTHLPSLDFLFEIHPEYAKFGNEYARYAYSLSEEMLAIRLGDSILFDFMRDTFADPKLLPHPNEMTHYPLIFAGYLGMFFTALNLLPIGQLDGGHILFSLIGDRNFRIVSPILFVIFVTYAGLGFYTYEEFIRVAEDEFFYFLMKFLAYIFFNYLCFSRVFEHAVSNWILTLSVVIFQLAMSYFFPAVMGYAGFMAFGFLLGRVLGIYHPPVLIEEPIGPVRMILGWLSLLIFIICFSPQPLN